MQPMHTGKPPSTVRWPSAQAPPGCESKTLIIEPTIENFATIVKETKSGSSNPSNTMVFRIVICFLEAEIFYHTRTDLIDGYQELDLLHSCGYRACFVNSEPL